MKKFRIFYDFDQEERYLNEMAKKGYLLEKYTMFGFYYFAEGDPQDLHYRIDYRSFSSEKDFEDYLTLFEDAGWQHVYGTRNSMYQFFLPTDRGSTADIFSTSQSAALRYKKLCELCSANIAISLVYFIVVFASCGFDLSKIAFLTPGLWEMTGAQFWDAFFFELPFMLLRTVPILAFLVYGIIFAIWAGNVKKLYDSKMQQ